MFVLCLWAVAGQDDNNSDDGNDTMLASRLIGVLGGSSICGKVSELELWIGGGGQSGSVHRRTGKGRKPDVASSSNVGGATGSDWWAAHRAAHRLLRPSLSTARAFGALQSQERKR